jgi:hypothetical protein
MTDTPAKARAALNSDIQLLAARLLNQSLGRPTTWDDVKRLARVADVLRESLEC